MADLRAYSPRVLLEWEAMHGTDRHRPAAGTLVFADVSGFTKLSEKLERAGRVGAEQMAETINSLFGELLMLAAVRGGEMLKFGGDAMLLFFEHDEHALRAVTAAADMQRRLRQIGRVDTGAGIVRLRMSIGAHSGEFDLFVGGRLHQELVVAGPATTITGAMEAAADAKEILLSPSTAALLPARHVGAAKAGGFLLRGHPSAPLVETTPLPPGLDGRRFLDPALARHLSARQRQPEHRLATISFLQFLELDRLLDAGRVDEAATRVDDVLTLVQESYREFGVTFLATDLAADGGKVMASTGAPTSHDDDVERMLRAARRILDTGPALPVRIGVNRGHVFAGDVGPSFRRTYTAMGDVTNTAARLMGRATAGQCLALERVLTATPVRWSAEELEPFHAKGKAEQLVPWLVGRPGARLTREPAGPMMGRAEELAVLMAALERSRSTSQSIDVVGEPGVGKSRLVGELLSAARAAGRPVLHVRCDPFTASTPYVTATTLASLLEPGLTRERVAAIVRSRSPELEPELPLLAISLGLEPTEAAAIDIDPAVLPQRIAAATAAFLSQLLGDGAVALVEDAHWADEASAAVLTSLIDSRQGATSLLLGAARRDVDQGWEPPAPDVKVSLGPLDPASARTLIEALTPRPLLPEEVERMVERAGGNALFAEQLATATTGASLPDTLEEVIATRIDKLPPRSRELLRNLSVLGPAFSMDMVGAVSDERRLPASLRSFVTQEGAGARFSHALVQEAAYDSLPFRRRRELHRRVVAHLLTLDTGPARVEELSIHSDAGTMWPEAWRYATEAARNAETAYAFSIAAGHWERAARAARLAGSVDTADVAAAWMACGEANRRAGRVAHAHEAFRTGRKAAPSGSPQAVALAASLGRARLLEGRLSGASTWAKRAQLELGQLGERSSLEVEAAVLELRAELADRRDRPAETVAIARELVHRAERAGDLALQARAQATVHGAAVRLGLPEAAREGERALDLARRAGNLRTLVGILSNLGEAAVRHAHWQEATAYYADASDAAERGGFTLGRAVIDNNVAEILTQQGRLDAAMVLFERSRTTAAAAGHWHAAFLTANVAWCLGLQGSFERADREFEEAERSLVELGLASILPEVDRRRVEVLLLRGGGDAALRVLEGKALAPEIDSDPQLRAARSQALRQLGRHEEAFAAAASALRLAGEHEHPFAELVAAEAMHRLGHDDHGLIEERCRALDIVARPALP